MIIIQDVFFFNCFPPLSVLKRKNPCSQPDPLHWCKEYVDFHIRKLLAGCKSFSFSVWRIGRANKKAPWSELAMNIRKEEFFLYFYIVLANIHLKIQKSGKLLESFDLHIGVRILSAKSKKSTSQLRSSDIRNRSSNKQFAYFSFQSIGTQEVNVRAAE